jgi:hypothetical protein
MDLPSEAGPARGRLRHFGGQILNTLLSAFGFDLDPSADV